MANDLSTWLCNMYVEIRQVSRDRVISLPEESLGLNFIKKVQIFLEIL